MLLSSLFLFFFFLMIRRPPRSTRTDNSFPTRRSSDLYVNQFIDRGRVKRVFVQGDAPSRMLPEDFGQWYVRNAQGEMRSEEHTSELQSLMRISYAVFCLKKKKNKNNTYMTSRLQTNKYNKKKLSITHDRCTTHN